MKPARQRAFEFHLLKVQFVPLLRLMFWQGYVLRQQPRQNLVQLHQLSQLQWPH